MGLRLFLLSVLLFLASGTSYLGATQYSYLAAGNVSFVHGYLIAVCWLFFLLSLAFVVIASTDREGRLRTPSSFGALLCWGLLIPQAGFAIGSLTNFQSSLGMMLTLSNSHGEKVRFLENGVAMLDGAIGLDTPESLSEEYRRNNIKFLILQSSGGLINSANSMGSFVKEKNISIYVKDTCASACVIVALNGEKLYVLPNTKFGFHKSSAVAYRDSELGRFVSNEGTDTMLSQLGSLGVPDDILQKTKQTPPDSVYYVSGKEFVRLGLAEYLEK